MVKLKAFVTQVGFFEYAVAAPSIKAATAALGISPNYFKHGFAKKTNDKNIVAAVVAKPGTVLERTVGTKGKFTDHAKLPTIKAGKKNYKNDNVKKSVLEVRKNNRENAAAAKTEAIRNNVLATMERAQKKHDAIWRISTRKNYTLKK